MTTTWITEGHHFNHANIVKFCSRPFESLPHMHNEMIDTWNKYVKPNDTVIHAGDFSLGNLAETAKIWQRLNGNIHILSNPWHHDKRWLLKFDLEYGNNRVMAGTATVILEGPIYIIKRDPKPNIVVCHYPMRVWDKKHYGAYHVYGHIHKDHDSLPGSFWIGVDHAYRMTGEYRPFSTDEIDRYLKDWTGTLDSELDE